MAGEVTLLGGAELIRKFGELPGKLQRKALRRGVTKAARRTVKQAKQEAPRETGLLRQSLGQRTYTLRDKSGVGAVVGVRKGTNKRSSKVGVVRSKRGGFRKARKGESATSYRNPEKYLHLVLLGTEHSKPNNFLLRAAQQTRAESIRTISAECRQQLERGTVKS